VFEDPVADALDQLERAADEKIRETDIIDPPTGTARVAEPASTTSTTNTSRRDAPMSVKPRRRSAVERGGWTVTAIFVALLAVMVLGMSIAGLVWLMRSG
jgi:hypothetical protein